MKKRITKSIFLSLLFISLLGTSIVYAKDKYIGEFTFKFYSNVIGKTKFQMENQSTKCISEAGQYRDGIIYTNQQFNYKIDLESTKLFGKTYKGSYIPADLNKYTTYYNTINEGTYTVNVDTEFSLAPYGVQIIGSGTLYQY